MPSLDELIAQDKIPNDPDILNGIRAGKLDTDKVIRIYEEWKGPQAAPIAVPQPGPAPKKLFQRASEQAEPDNGMKVLQEMAANDELPQIPDVLEGIAAGKYNLDKVMANYAEIKKTMPNMVGNSKGELNFPEDEKVTAKVELETPDLGLGDQLKAAGKREWDRFLHVGSQFLAGATFEVIDPELEAPDTIASFEGKIAYLGGMLLTGGLAGKALRAAPLIGKGIKALETGAKAAGIGKKAKIAKELGAIALEAAPLGFGVGVAKGIIHRNDIPEILAEGVIDAAVFTAGGAALYPVAVGAGKLFARRKVAKAKAATVKAEEAGKELAAEIVKPGAESGKSPMDARIEQLEAIPEKQLSPESAQELITLKKIKAIDPTLGPAQALALAKEPEIVQRFYNADLESSAKGLLTDEGALLKPLYDSNKSIKSMMDQGNYVDVLQSLQPAYGDVLRKEAKTVGEFMASPFADNAEAMLKRVADKVVRRANPSKQPGLNQTLLVQYWKHPSKANLEAIEAAVPTGKTKIFGKELHGLKDVRLSSGDIDAITGDILKANLETLASGGTVKFENIGKLKDADSIFKTAVTFNKDLARTTIDASMNGMGSLFEDFAYAPPEVQVAIKHEANIRRLMIEKQPIIAKASETRARIGDLKRDLKTATEQAKPEIKAELKNLNNSLREISRQMYGMRKQTNEASALLDALSPETRTQVKDFVSQIYIPRKADLNFKQTQAYFEALFQYKDNPAYIKNRSGLADMLHAMTIAEKGFDIKVGGAFALPFGPNPFNLRRQLNRDFGPDNEFSRMLDLLRDRQAFGKRLKSDLFKNVEAIGTKEGMEESALIHDFIEGRLLPTSAEFLKLPAKTQELITSGAQKASAIFEDLIDNHNALAEIWNLPQINKLGSKDSGYVTHYAETAENLWSLIDQFVGGSQTLKLATRENVPVNVFRETHKSDPSKTVLKYEWARSGGEFKRDVIGALNRYVDPMVDRIIYMDLIRELDVARNYSPNNLVTFFDHIKKNIILKTPPEMVKTGTYTGSGPLSLKILEFTRKRLAEGSLFYNLNTIVQQGTSTALSFAYGGREGIAAWAKMGTKEAERLWGLSTNRAIRNPVENVNLDARIFGGMMKEWSKNKPIQSAKNAYDYIKRFGRFGLEKADEIAARHTFLTAHLKASKAGLDEAAAIRYADKAVDMIHNSLARVDLPAAFLGNPWMKSIYQFQSFTINLGATLMNDLPNMAFHDGAAKAVTAVLKGGAAISIANEAFREIGLPAPFDLQTFIPGLSNAKFGTPGFLGAVKDFAISRVGSEQEKAQANRDLWRFGAAMAVPGGGQLVKAAQAFGARKKGKISPRQAPLAYAFGPGSVLKAKKTKEESRGTFLGKRRRAAIKKVKKLFK